MALPIFLWLAHSMLYLGAPHNTLNTTVAGSLNHKKFKNSLLPQKDIVIVIIKEGSSGGIHEWEYGSNHLIFEIEKEEKKTLQTCTYNNTFNNN